MRTRHAIGALALLVTLLVGSTPADAKIKLRLLEGNDLFYFHVQVNDPTFPSFVGTLRFEVWNAAGMIYAVDVSTAACTATSTARWCVFRDKAAKQARSGLAYFKILYQAQSHGNKIYLESYGDLSAATDPVMSFKIFQNDELYAELNNVVFKPTHSGWVGF